MTYGDYVAEVAEKLGTSKVETRRFLNASIAVLSDAMYAGDVVKIAKLGVFSTRVQKARTGVIPYKKLPYSSKAKSHVKVKLAPRFRDRATHVNA